MFSCGFLVQIPCSSCFFSGLLGTAKQSDADS